eukprot:TRINITY_DN19187_c0_g1_i2.p1 TRINITY_DN19187_c0_g1~~TRINITY_DN19187_c0_g1_i2.p1  ORF type:complete len:209 (+),score=35.76 TRINITY_DN19187_c0_g1_i2:30-629(+)
MGVMKGIFLLFLFTTVCSLEFYYTIQKTARRCFEDHLSERALAGGEVFFSKRGRIGLEVEGPLNDVVLSKEFREGGRNRFSFTSSQSGKHMICFKNYQNEPIELKLKLNSAVDFIIDKNELNGNLTRIEHDIYMTLNYSQQVNKLMTDLRKHATEDNAIGSATTKRVIVFGIISISVIIVSAVVQIFYLRMFFKERKMV